MHRQRNTILDIYDLGTSAGFRIDWQNSAFNVGMDDITFASAALIPEAGTHATFMAGRALLGFVVNRRTRRA